MRIALVYRSFHLLGSLARETVELARHLSQRHEVHVFSIAARTDPTLAPECTFHDVPVETLGDGVHFSVRELMAFGPRAAQLVMQERFDVVHVCSPSTWVGDVLNLPGVAPGEAALRGHSHARFVAGALRRPGNAARWLIERRAVANPALRRIHVPTARVLADVQRYYGIAADRILVVPPGVNLAEFRATVSSATARKDVPLDERRVVLLFCGSDFERKGLDRAIEMLVATKSTRSCWSWAAIETRIAFAALRRPAGSETACTSWEAAATSPATTGPRTSSCFRPVRTYEGYADRGDGDGHPVDRGGWRGLRVRRPRHRCSIAPVGAVRRTRVSSGGRTTRPIPYSAGPWARRAWRPQLRTPPRVVANSSSKTY